jgi:GNAT superfamily N-acetyltransferase
MNRMDYPCVDAELARRLERTEAQANIDCVEARASATPGIGAAWRNIGGTFAMFDGITSPLTQTFCLGISRPVSPGEVTDIESFYRERGAPVFHEVSPLADASTLPLLSSRGYQPIEFTSLLYRPVGQAPAQLNPRIQVTIARQDRADTWVRTACEGWREHTELSESISDLMRVVAGRANGLCFLAELDGTPIAAGSLFIFDGVALLAGASTIPDARRQGAQRALLAARMEYARQNGCDLLMMGAAPGSASQRNAERQGFRIAYTRIKWKKAGD